MKKFAFLLFLILCLAFSLCTYGEGERTESTQFSFELSEGQELYVTDLIFNEPVVISGDSSIIMFANCEFNADIILTSEVGTRVILTENNVVNGRCVLQNNLKEATLETSFPKFLAMIPVEVVCDNCCGVAVAAGDFELIFNNNAYTMADCELFLDLSDPNAGFVPYEGQEAHYFAIAQWWESGIMHTLVECEYDPTM